MNMNFPKHKAGLTIEHNPQKKLYETVAVFLKHTYPAFKDEEAKERVIASDDIWMIRWYPAKPTDFSFIAAPTLEEALAFALTIETEE